MSSAATRSSAPALGHAIVNPWRWQDEYGFVQGHSASMSGRTIFCAGQTSVDEEGLPLHVGDMAAQLERALRNVETVLVQSGSGLADVVRLNYYVTDLQAFYQTIAGFKARLERSGCRPASTLLCVAGLHHADILVEMEATAVMAAESRPWPL